MRVMSVFTGAGGFELGLPDDWEVVGQSEVDKFCNRVLDFRFPDVKNYGDICEIGRSNLPDFDVLVGGSPCQDYSVIGNREGSGGRRGGLSGEYVRLLRECQPKYFIFENVRGLFSSNKGWDFAKLLFDMADAGYDLRWQLLNAKYFGVPHNRERLFIVGNLRGQPIGEVFLDTESTQAYYERQEIQAAHCLDSNYYKGIDNHGQRTALGFSNRWLETNREKLRPISPCLSTMNDNCVLDPENVKVRKLTPLECERLMSWPDDWTKYGLKNGKVVQMSDTQRYKMCGNGVVSNVVKAITDGML